jgi:hypothetical protein
MRRLMRTAIKQAASFLFFGNVRLFRRPILEGANGANVIDGEVH